MAQTTAERQVKLLNAYQAGEQWAVEWARSAIGRFDILSWSWGEVRLRWTPDEKQLLPDGIMFGGHIAAVADHAGFFGAATVLTEDDEWFRTTRLETNYFRPLTADETEIAVRVTNSAKSLIHVEADILTSDNKLAVRAYIIQQRVRAG